MKKSIEDLKFINYVSQFTNDNPYKDPGFSTVFEEYQHVLPKERVILGSKTEIRDKFLKI
jgi:hypothetical protein